MTHQEGLQQAEQFQAQAAVKCADTYWRPKYHIAAPAGWINDPNGFCYFDNKYHLFYQYHPYSSQWGPMHWGHVSSSDLANWQTEPIALAPTDSYDADGCFSGSAIAKDGKLYLLYTGHVDLDKSLGGDDRIESQCLAVSDDGIHFTKAAANPVIAALPKNLNIRSEHFRDPKIWQHGDMYYTVVGAQTKQETGQVVVYKSRDLHNWEFVNIMAQSFDNENAGFMWECPNFAEIDGCEALILSPQGMQPEGDKFLNLHQSGYFLGKMDYATGVFSRKADFDMLDYGFDFYAPQIMQDELNSRCLMIAWLDMWESDMQEQQDGWSGMMSVPRVLNVKDGMIYSTPAPELAKLRKQKVHHQLTTDAAATFADVQGDCYELHTTVDLKTAQGFALKLRACDTEETVLTYNVKTHTFTLNRDKSGKALTGERKVQIDTLNDKLDLQIFSDRSSLEIFLNGGQRVLSTRIYPTPNATGIEFIPNGLVDLTVDFYQI